MKLINQLVLSAAIITNCLIGSLGNMVAAAQAFVGEASTKRVGCPVHAELNAILARASASMQQGSYSSVPSILGPLEQLRCDPRVTLLFVAALEANGRVETANTTLVQAHQFWPVNNSIAATLAREDLAAGKIDEARMALNHFHIKSTTPLQEIQLDVAVLLASNQLVAANSMAESAYKFHQSLETLLLLANTLQVQGRYKDVITLLQPKRSTYLSSAAFLVTLAESEYDAILYDTARRDLEQAITLDAQSYQAHFLYGNVLMKDTQNANAIVQYRAAIALSPQQPRTHYQLALALEAEHDEVAAEHELTEVLSLDEHYAPAHLEMGRILLNRSNLPEATTQLQEAAQENPTSEQAYFLLAKIYGQTGDKERSGEMTKRLAEVRNANSKAHFGRNKAAAVAPHAGRPDV